MQRKHFLQSVALTALGIHALCGSDFAFASPAQSAEMKQILDQINTLRADPAGAKATLDKLVAAAFPDAKARTDVLAEKYGEKTHAEHLARVAAFLAGKPKMAALVWDADLAAVAGEGKSRNTTFTPEHTMDTFEKAPNVALLWTLLRGVDFHYESLFNPNFRYIGIGPKGEALNIMVSATPGKAFALTDDEIGKMPYDPRLDDAPAWVFALLLKEPNIIPVARPDGSLDVAWREMGSKQVFVSRYSAAGAKVWTKSIGGVEADEHKILMGFTEDVSGDMYVVRAVDEAAPGQNIDTPKDNPNNAFDRAELVKLTKLDSNANVLWTKDFAKKGGGAEGYFSPMSASGKGTYGASSRIAYTTVKRAVYKLADKPNIVVPPQVAERSLLGFSIDRLGKKSSNRFDTKFQPIEAGGVLTPKVKLSFDEKYAKGTLFAPVADPGKPVAFFDDGGVPAWSEYSYLVDSNEGFAQYVEANKVAEDKFFFVAPDKLKMTLAIEEVPVLFMIYGAATAWDPAINGRHQNAYWRAVDARTGEPIEDFNGGAMAHSFDARVLVSDEGIITAERSDMIQLMSNYLQTRPGPVFMPVISSISDVNESFTQIGGIAQATDGYLYIYAANNYASVAGKNRDDGVTDAQLEEESIRQRDIGVLRLKKGFAQEIEALEDARGKDEFDKLMDHRKPTPTFGSFYLLPRKYITSYYKDNQPYSAARPNVVRVSDGNYVVFWERWSQRVVKNDQGKRSLDGNFDSTWAMKIDQNGNVLKPATKLSDTLRLMRGDDPIALGGKAAFVTGDVVQNKLVLHTIDANLNYQATPLAR